MKKFFSVITSLGVLCTTTSVGLLNFNQTSQTEISTTSSNTSVNNYEAMYNWVDVKIKHMVETNNTGEVVKDSKATIKSVDKSWDDLFMKTRLLVVSGEFALHTYKEPQYFNDVLLKLNNEKSTNLERVWEFERTHETENEWSDYVAGIKLTVIAKYDEKQAITNLSINSYIFANSDDIINNSYALSQVNIIRFLAD